MIKKKYLRSNIKVMIFKNSNSKIFIIIFCFKYEESVKEISLDERIIFYFLMKIHAEY